MFSHQFQPFVSYKSKFNPSYRATLCIIKTKVADPVPFLPDPDSDPWIRSYNKPEPDTGDSKRLNPDPNPA